MNVKEVAQLLTLASGFDNRKVDQVNTLAWFEVLRDADYEAAKAAVIAHQAGPRRHEYLTVAHVVDALKADVRETRFQVEADVRAAKGYGLIGRDWPRGDVLPSDVADRLAAARADAREAAALEVAPGAGVETGQIGWPA